MWRPPWAPFVLRAPEDASTETGEGAPDEDAAAAELDVDAYAEYPHRSGLYLVWRACERWGIPPWAWHTVPEDHRTLALAYEGVRLYEEQPRTMNSEEGRE